MRGCQRGCHFCQAGMIYRPVQERRLNTLLQQAEARIRSTGCDEVSWFRLSTPGLFTGESLVTWNW